MNTVLKTNLSREIRQYFQLFALAAFSVGLLLIRAKMTQSIYFFFLIWNLFLAYTPLAVSSILIRYKALRNTWYYSYPALFCWLLLLPNAPYLITDFIHLRAATPVPVWFDVLILASFTLTGLLFWAGFYAKYLPVTGYKIWEWVRKLHTAYSQYSQCFGIYLGRFMRYNSWDILHKPISLITDIILSLFSEDTWKPAWGITIGFGLLQYLLFDLYNSMKR